MVFCPKVNTGKFQYSINQNFFFESTNAEPNAEIIIVNEKCLDDLFLRGDLGWAESYIRENSEIF